MYRKINFLISNYRYVGKHWQTKFNCWMTSINFEIQTCLFKQRSFDLYLRQGHTYEYVEHVESIKVMSRN